MSLFDSLKQKIAAPAKKVESYIAGNFRPALRDTGHFVDQIFHPIQTSFNAAPISLKQASGETFDFAKTIGSLGLYHPKTPFIQQTKKKALTLIPDSTLPGFVSPYKYAASAPSDRPQIVASAQKQTDDFLNAVRTGDNKGVINSGYAQNIGGFSGGIESNPNILNGARKVVKALKKGAAGTIDTINAAEFNFQNRAAIADAASKVHAPIHPDQINNAVERTFTEEGALKAIKDGGSLGNAFQGDVNTGSNARQPKVTVTVNPKTGEVLSVVPDRPEFTEFLQTAAKGAPISPPKGTISKYQRLKGNPVGPDEQLSLNGVRFRSDNPLKERGFVTSVKESPNVSGEVKSLVDSSYIPKPDTQLMGEAKALLSEGGSIDFKNTADLDKKVAATIQEAINQDAVGNPEAAASLYNNLSEHGTNLGRGVHAFSLLKKMSPEAIALSAAGQIKKFNRIHGAKIPELNGEQVSLIGEKVKTIMGMAEGREKNIALNELQNTLSGFIPSSLADKALTVWKAGLLTSLRTHERNFLGNAIHGVAEVAKDIPAAGADMLMSTATGKRTLSATVKGVSEFGSKSTGQQMADIIAKGFDPTEQVNKFDYKKITWAKTPVQQFLKHYTDAVFNTLGASDKPFYNAALSRSLYDQAGAAAINAGKRGDRGFIEALVKSPTEDMVKAAVSDANVATFKNKNAASSVSTAIKQALVNAGQNNAGNVGGEVGKVIGEMTMPFTGVPSSILGQTIAYSPVGLLKGMVKTGRVVAGQVPELQRQAAQELGRGVIGTGVFGLGAYLASKGLITGQPKDAEEARLWDTQNKPRNSILVGGKWRSLNSVGPEMIVTLAGAKLNDELAKPDGSAATFGVSLAKDQLDQSFLTGVQAPINAITDPARYGKSYAGGLLSSGIPNLAKDTAKAFDPTQREMNTVLDYAQGNIPGARNLMTPKRDVLGNTMKQEPTGVNAFLDVFNSKTPNTEPVVNELERLYNSGNGATPSKLNKSFTVFGQKLTLNPQELDKLEASSGGEVTKRLQSLMDMDGYQGLPDEQKAKLLNGIVDEVRSTAKKRLGAPGSASIVTAGGVNTNSASTSRPTKDQIDVTKFQVEQDQQTRKVGDTYVYYDPESGSAKIRTDNSIQQDTQIQQIKNDLDAALKTKNYVAWRSAAEKQYSVLEAQTKALDPIIDAAKILANQNTMQDLQLKYLTYKGYGGLSKPKKGGSKFARTTLHKITAKKPALARSGSSKTISTSQKLKTLSLKAPSGNAKAKRIRKSSS